MKQIFLLTLLLGLFTAAPTFAQTDVSQNIKDLPKKDGIYLLVVLDDLYFYAVKKNGRITKYEVTDANGQPVPEGSPSPAENNARAAGSEIPRSGTGVTTTPVCSSPPDQICRWSTVTKSCACISTVLK